MCDMITSEQFGMECCISEGQQISERVLVLLRDFKLLALTVRDTT
jgi:hypothetical protein